MWQLNFELHYKVGFLSKSVTYIPSVPGCLVQAGAHRELVVDEVGADDGDLAEQVQLLLQVSLQVRGGEALSTYRTPIQASQTRS